jgi:hypothetical protein
MNGLMLKTAKELSSENAGGHGDRWGVLTGGADALFDNLPKIIEKSEWFDAGIVDKAATQAVVTEGEPFCIPLLYTGLEKGTSKTGAMSLHVPNQAAKELKLWSAYPFFGEGVEIEGVVGQILLHPNHVEATLEIAVKNGVLIKAFDSLFCQSRALYRSGQSYRFSLSALAYSMNPPGHIEKTIDDPDDIRHYHATQAWAEKYGQYAKEDEAQALAAWQPQTPEDLEPIRIEIDSGTVFIPSGNGFSDDALYLGEVVCVTADAARVLDTSFWRVDVVVVRSEELETLIIPIYVSENLLEGDWRPSVGEHVTGNVWLQAYAIASR